MALILSLKESERKVQAAKHRVSRAIGRKCKLYSKSNSDESALLS